MILQPISFTIPGEPRGKGRPRFARRGEFVKTYTDEKTASYEGMVAYHFMQGNPEAKPIIGPVAVEITAYLKPPKAKKKLGRPPLKKPDLDNIMKIVCDSLNGLAWIDDSLVVEATVSKHWATENNPRVTVFIRDLTYDFAL